MKRAWMVSAFTICVGLIGATSYILLTPTSAFAATGEATCPNGQVVTCAAYLCACTDGFGCVAQDKEGRQTLKPCPTGPPKGVAILLPE